MSASQVLLETLRRTSEGRSANKLDIAQAARTTSNIVSGALEQFVGVCDDTFSMASATRLRLALQAARLGDLREVARALTWQEFEEFGKECLDDAGFETRRGVVFKDGSKRWQIDLVAIKGQMLLSFDCKRWESPLYSSKFSRAVEHHKNSLGPLMSHMIQKVRLVSQKVWGLPVILTLSRPRTSIIDGVVLTSIEQLSDFVQHLTPYDADIPFASARAESPISKTVRPRRDLT